MMQLSTMWSIDRTIEEDGRSPVADAAAGPWTPDPGWPRFVRSSVNVVYALERQGSPAFLRFAADSERRREGIDAEVRMLDTLAGDGHAVARPLRSARGNLVETVETSAGTMHAALFTALEGDQFEIEDLDSAQFHRWGGALGTLHGAMGRVTDESATTRPSWRDQLDDVHPIIASGPPAVRREYADIVATLDTLPQRDDTYGLIHGDFELDNLVWNGDAVGALDFDDAAFSWYAADIAFALRDVFAEGFDAANPSFRAFLDGYAAAHPQPLDGMTIDHVPLFLRHSKLTTYAKMIRALDLPENADNHHPAWLTDLADKLRDRAAAYEALLSA